MANSFINGQLVMSFRFKSFFVHLSISILIALFSVLIVFGVWYPSPVHSMVDLTEIFIILLVVDVVMGPVLTFVVSQPDKKSLKIDLSIIIFLQISAFLYGMHTVAEGRPVWMVFVGDRFEMVQAFEVDSTHRSESAKAFAELSWVGPQWAAAKLPDNPEKREELLFSALAGGADLAQRPDLYIPYQDAVPDIRKQAISISHLPKFNNAEKLAQVFDKWPEADSFLPLYSRTRGASMSVLLNHETAEVVAIVDLNPW